MKSHIFNAIAYALLALLMGWLFTMTTPGSASAARQVLFLFTVGSAAASVRSIVAFFSRDTGGEVQSLSPHKENNNE